MTHLLVCGDAQDQNEEGFLSDKVQWALGNNRRRRQFKEGGGRKNGATSDKGEDLPEVHVIWSEWFWDCLEAGGQF